MNCNESSTGEVYVSVTRGDTMRLIVDLGAGSGEIDVTGWSWLCQVRDAEGALVETMTVEVVEAGKGVLELMLSAEQTATMQAQDYVWDLQATDAASDVRTLVRGQLRVREDVSA
jgi:hypothetical protein